MGNKSLIVALVLLSAVSAFAQSPSPTLTDNRGLGIQSSGQIPNTSGNQGSREAKPELVLQTGYSNLYGAMRLVFSPDGRLLATGTYRSNTIKLWETATTRKLRDLSSSGQAVPALAPIVAFSRDSRLVAASGGDNSVTVWDVVSGRELHKLGGSSQGSMMAPLGVYFIAFTPDNRLVTISDAVRVWDLSTGRELNSFAPEVTGVAGFNGSEGGLTLSPDGAQLLLVTAGPDPEVRIIDLASGRDARRVKLPGDEMDSLQLSFNPDGHLLAAGIHDKRLNFFDLTAKKDRELGPTTKEFPQVRFSRDGRLLALSDNYTVKLWDTATFRELPAVTVPTSINFPEGDAFVSFSEDGKRLATGGIGTDTIVWETETGKRLSTMNGRTNMAYNVAFSADGMELISGGRTRWDLRTGRGLRIVPDATEKTYGTVSSDGKVVAVMKLNSNVLTIEESPSGRLLHTLAPSGEAGQIIRSRFSADSSMLAVLYGIVVDQHASRTMSLPRGSQIKIWDVKSGAELRSITPTEVPMQAEFTADGRSLAIISGMGAISLWDVQSGSKLRDLTSSPMAAFKPPVFTPGQIKRGQMPAMPNMDDMAKILTNTIGTMSAGTMGQSVTSLAFTNDGHTLATGGVESKSNFDLGAMMNSAMTQRPKKGSKAPDPADMMKDFKVEAVGRVQLWDVASGREIGAISGHGRGVSKVAFSRDGKLLASGGTDSTIKIWDVATQKELRTLTGYTAPIERS